MPSESSSQSQPGPKPIKCPICRKLSVNQNVKTFPFCSDRCKLIDLGRWLDGSYQIEARDPDDEIDESSLPTWKPET